MSTLVLLAYVVLLSVARLVVDDTAVSEGFSWPNLISNGFTLATLIAFFIWQNRQMTLGKIYAAPIVRTMLDEKDKTIAEKVAEVAGLRFVVEEQVKTIRALESTNDLTGKALVQATSNQGWVDTLVKKALGGSVFTPSSGDNTTEGVAP